MNESLVRDVAGLVSMVTALVAVFIGPRITAKIQHLQTIATMRQQWIQDLRQSLAELFSNAEVAASSIYPIRKDNKELQDVYDRIVKIEAKAIMMLNPKDHHHIELQTKLEEIVALADDNSLIVENKMSRMRKLIQSTIPISQVVLKDAWDKIK